MGECHGLDWPDRISQERLECSPTNAESHRSLSHLPNMSRVSLRSTVSSDDRISDRYYDNAARSIARVCTFSSLLLVLFWSIIAYCPYCANLLVFQVWPYFPTVGILILLSFSRLGSSRVGKGALMILLAYLTTSLVLLNSDLIWVVVFCSSIMLSNCCAFEGYLCISGTGSSAFSLDEEALVPSRGNLTLDTLKTFLWIFAAAFVLTLTLTIVSVKIKTDSAVFFGLFLGARISILVDVLILRRWRWFYHLVGYKGFDFSEIRTACSVASDSDLYDY